MNTTNLAFFSLLMIAYLAVIINADPVCPYYPYRDFYWQQNYIAPSRPLDSLIDNCNSLNLTDGTICNQITNPNLSIEEKKQLITDGLVTDNGFPGFDTAKNWNYGLAFDGYPPDGVNATTSGEIWNAWVKILSVNPSVYDSNTNELLINDSGEVYTQDYFAFVIQQQSFPSDCYTDYEVCGYNYNLNTYENGNYLNNGNSKTADFSLNSFVNNESHVFTSTLQVNTEYFINHYRKTSHCQFWNDQNYCWTTCDYSYSDDRKSTLTLSDSKEAHYYNFIDFEKSIIDSIANGVVNGWLFLLSNNDFNNFVFTIGNSSLKVQGRQYYFTNGLAPYNILTPEAAGNPNNLQTLNIGILSRNNTILSGTQIDSFLQLNEPFLYYVITNIFNIDLKSLPITFYGDKIHFLAPSDSTNCSIVVNSHFETKKIDNFCYNPSQEPTITLSILNETNQSFTVNMRFVDNFSSVPLPGKSISLYYGNRSVSVQTDANGEASAVFAIVPGVNLVKAVFLTDFQTKSAESEITLQNAAPDFNIYYWIGLLVALYLFSKLGRGVVKHAV